MQNRPSAAVPIAETGTSPAKRVALIGGAVLATVVGCCTYLEWRPQHGSERKTQDVLHSSLDIPEPLGLGDIDNANLLKILQQREVRLGRHCIAVRLDEEERARLRVRTYGGTAKREFRLGGGTGLAGAVDNALKEPDKSGIGFVMTKEGEEYVLRVTAAGLVARVKATDIDDALGEVLMQTPAQSSIATLALPYRSRVPFCLEDQCGIQAIELIAVQADIPVNIAQGK